MALATLATIEDVVARINSKFSTEKPAGGFADAATLAGVKAITDAATAVATAGAVARRDSNGDAAFRELTVAQDPSGANALSRKSWVDTQIASRLATSLLGAASGVASLDAGGKIPTSQLPPLAINETFVAASQAAMLALTAQRGDMARRTDLTPNRIFVLAADDPTTLANWIEINAAGSVTSVDGQTGAVSLGSATASASTLARRTGTGQLVAADALAASEVATFGQLSVFGRDRGTGTTLPSTDLRVGDNYRHQTYGFFIYSGAAWRQEFPYEITSTQRASLNTSSADIYVGFRVFETDTRRLWQWGGSTPGWEYLGGGSEPTELLTINTQNFNHYSTANPAAATARYEALVLSRLPGDGARISGLISITTQTTGGTWYQLVTAPNIPVWARPKRRTIRYYPLNGSQTLGRLDMIPPDGTYGDAAAGSLAYYCPTTVAPGTIMNVDMNYQPNNALL